MARGSTLTALDNPEEVAAAAIRRKASRQHDEPLPASPKKRFSFSMGFRMTKSQSPLIDK
jgi:hypothetical protein